MKKSGRKSNQPKFLSPTASLGQLGVNLIERLVTSMGSRWTPSNSTEVGIDGYVELFDSISREATGLHLAVQSKAVSTLQGNENEVTYDCRRRDVAYWLSVSPPVILVVSNPNGDEAYWLSVREFFEHPDRKDSLRAVFDRKKQRLGANSYSALVDVAQSGSGRPPPMRAAIASLETLYSNLVPVVAAPKHIYVAAATVSTYKEANAHFGDPAKVRDYPPRCWLLHESNLLSFVDPEACRLNEVCDIGSMEQHNSSDWSQSSDPVKQRQFVQLMNKALQDHLAPRGVKYYSDGKVYVFKARRGASRTHSYTGLQKKSTLTVVESYSSKSKDGRVFPYFRHLAFGARFRKFGTQWYLELNTTYRFTTDGHEKYRFHEDQLSGIKRMEGNRAVLSQVLVCNDILRQPLGMFSHCKSELQFGSVATFQCNRAVPDDDWSVGASTSIEETSQLDFFQALQANGHSDASS